MHVDPFRISMDTLIGAAPLLGHGLEDRTKIRDAQNWSMIRKLHGLTSARLRDDSQRDLFTVAPLDVLVTRRGGRKVFQIIEINGTGIGGLTNLPGPAVGSVLDSMGDLTRRLHQPDAVVLVASSGKEDPGSPRRNKLLHEKVLYAEALKQGFDQSGRAASVFALPHLAEHRGAWHENRPAVVLGYMKDFLDHLQPAADGTLTLLGRPVHAAINDRFCLNLLQRFEGKIDLAKLWTSNRGFLAGADKGVAYALLNRFQRQHEVPAFPREVVFERHGDRESLLARLLTWVRSGRKCLIKPQGTGLGHGIEFFLDAAESDASIAGRLDASLQQTAAYYGIPGGAFPYTLCEFLDTCTIPHRDHALYGHRYELRIVVYRDRMHLKAVPSIVKIASETYDPAQQNRNGLINNITASAQAKHAAGTEFMLPLSNHETLDLLGLRWQELVDLCAACTRFLRFTLDQVQDDPETFLLPRGTPVAAYTETAA